MREVVRSVHPVGIHRAQILDLKFDQRACELCRVAEILCELIRLKLVPTAENVHQELDDCVHGREGIGKEDEADYDGELLVETE